MMARHRLAGAIALLVVAVLGAGCEDEDPEPRVSPTPSASTSSIAATPTEPATSGSATPAAETPEEFIRRWNAASTQMQNTGETAEYLALVTKGCSACQKLARTISGYYRNGGYAKASPWDFVSFTPRPGSTDTAQEVEVVFDAEPTEYRTSAEAAVETTSGGRTVLAISLIKDGSSWLVDNYVVVPT